MMTKAVRLHGANDLRLDTFRLPEIKDDEILVKIISDSICMSSYKAAIQGEKHKRVPANISEVPIIIGHEFCGVIEQVGSRWASEFKPGEKFGIQPAINYHGTLHTPGYSFPYMGGATQYAVLLPEVMENGSLLHYDAPEFFYGSLAEPMSCIVGAFHAQYHLKAGSYFHHMGIVEGGNLAILAGAGPMGLGAIDYAVHCDRKPGLLVVTDIDQTRLDRAESIFSVEEAAKHGVKLVYLNTSGEDPVQRLMDLTDGKGYDDVFVFAPVAPVIEQGDRILGFDGCLNFFAGPTNPNLSAMFNFYDVHYNSHHIVGTSGGRTEDLVESLEMIAAQKLNPSSMVTHVGGLDAVIETTLNLPKIPGGKKLIYNHISLPLTAIADFKEKGKADPLFKTLAEICDRHNGLWSGEAEEFLLRNAKPI
ncbi:MAG: zinc-binding dehydrogenase [Clostridiales bacterium]|jgi:threonine dehydrogenase-like Zn-dependent dehydrogenase|nr:zinc-binding dehydrogenase [Clostridiales bacterium]OQA29733.1 MAG: Sorbitol dehydrogenase [Verrucomicrobia bacterium ADurb.Bin345]